MWAVYGVGSALICPSPGTLLDTYYDSGLPLNASEDIPIDDQSRQVVNWDLVVCKGMTYALVQWLIVCTTESFCALYSTNWLYKTMQLEESQWLSLFNNLILLMVMTVPLFLPLINSFQGSIIKKAYSCKRETSGSVHLKVILQ